MSAETPAIAGRKLIVRMLTVTGWTVFGVGSLLTVLHEGPRRERRGLRTTGRSTPPTPPQVPAVSRASRHHALPVLLRAPKPPPVPHRAPEPRPPVSQARPALQPAPEPQPAPQLDWAAAPLQPLPAAPRPALAEHSPSLAEPAWVLGAASPRPTGAFDWLTAPLQPRTAPAYPALQVVAGPTPPAFPEPPRAAAEPAVDAPVWTVLSAPTAAVDFHPAPLAVDSTPPRVTHRLPNRAVLPAPAPARVRAAAPALATPAAPAVAPAARARHTPPQDHPRRRRPNARRVPAPARASLAAPAAAPIRPPRGRRHVAHRIVGVGRWTILGAAAAVVAALFLPYLVGGRAFTVMSGSMTPAIRAGDVVINERISPSEARVGDVVTFVDPGGHKLITHRVRQMRVSDRGVVSFVTKGDQGNGVQSWSVPASGSIGLVRVKIPKLGYALWWARTPRGRLLCLVLPASLLGLFELRRIWRPRPEPVQAAREDSGAAPV